MPEQYNDNIHGTLPVTALEDCCFIDYLVSVTIPPTIKTIGDYAFQGCGLTTVSIPKSVEYIGRLAFSFCNMLKSIYVDNDNEYFSTDGRALFSQDKKKLYIYAERSGDSYEIPNGVSIIAFAAFSSTTLSTITIPSSVIDMDTAFLYCDCLQLKIIDKRNETYETDGRAIYNKTNKKITCYATASGNGYKIKNGTKILGSEAFECNRKIETIVLPDTLCTIEECAFRICWSLKSIFIPASVSSIAPNNTFLGCDSLSSIAIDDTNPYYSTDGHVIFNKNKSTLIFFAIPIKGRTYDVPSSVKTLESHSFCGSGFSNITLPDGLMKISDSAFLRSGLSSIKILSSVTYLGANAFKCNKSLFDFEYAGTISNFHSLLIRSNTTISAVFNGSSLKYVRCTDFNIAL